MRQRTLSQEQRERIVRRGGALAALTQHPSWPELVEEIELKKERLRERATANALSTKPVEQRELDYIRGFINGMEYLALVPANAEARLEAYLKENGVTEGATR